MPRSARGTRPRWSDPCTACVNSPCRPRSAAQRHAANQTRPIRSRSCGDLGRARITAGRVGLAQAAQVVPRLPVQGPAACRAPAARRRRPLHDRVGRGTRRLGASLSCALLRRATRADSSHARRDGGCSWTAPTASTKSGFRRPSSWTSSLPAAFRGAFGPVFTDTPHVNPKVLTLWAS